MPNLKKENTAKNIKNFIPYGTDPEKDKMVKSGDWEDRLEMVEEGYGLDILINDEDWVIREAVANQSYGLDILVNDEDWKVREAVADQGYGLDVLINDEDWLVRRVVLDYLKDNNLTLAEWYTQNNKEIDLKNLAYSPYPEARIAAIESGYVYKESEMYIAPDCKFIPYGTDPEKNKIVKSSDYGKRLKMAEEGYGLDILINDESGKVREAVAYQGYGLGILVNDEYWKVRKAVAKQGYGLDILVNDEYWKVRKAVLNYLKDNNLTLAEWCNQNNKEIDLKNLAYSPYPEARIVAIESGYVYKESEMYIAPDCKFIPYGTDPEKDKMVKSDDWEDRLEMAEEGYGLDVLINDKAWGVRAKVAKQGYGLDVLINDEDYDVRIAVVNQGYGLGILVNDEDYDVRVAVAKQGYGLNILINDEDWNVRKAVLNYLKDNNLTLAEWCNQNNKEIDLKNLAYSPYPEARVAAIKSGYVYKKIEMYIHTAPDRKFIPYGTDPKKDKMVKSDNWRDRLKMAEEGYGLDVLINDKDWEVRRAVAKQGYGLGILVNDEDYDVRVAVAKQGYGLNILINDEYWKVRAAVAEQGYDLDILINDEHWYVRETVEDYLTSHNLTLEQWKSNQDPSELSVSISKAEEFNPLDINTQKSEIQNLKDQINTLTKENKSLQKTLEKYVSVEKETDEKEL